MKEKDTLEDFRSKLQGFRPTEFVQDTLDPIPEESVTELCPDHQLPQEFNRLPKEIKDVMTCIDRLYGVDPALSLQVVLGTINAAIYEKFNVLPREWKQEEGVPISLYLGNVTETGGLKTTILEDVAEPIFQWESMQKRLVEDDLRHYALLRARYSKELSRWQNDPDATVQTAPREPEIIVTKNLILQNATRNGVLDTLAQQPGVAFITDEGGELFNSHSFKDAGSGTFFEALAFFTKLWNGGTVDRTVGKSKDNPDAHRSLRKRRCSMTFLTQLAPVRAILRNKEASEQGFMHRFLLTQANDVRVRKMTEVDHELNRKLRLHMRPFKRRIRKLLELPVITSAYSNVEVEPRKIAISPEVWQIIAVWHDHQVTSRRSEMPLYAGFFNRVVEHVIRLAANISVFIDETDEISERTMLASIDLMDYYIDQREQLEVGVTSRNTTAIDQRDELYKWIRTQHRATGAREWTLREIQQKGPAWYRNITKDERNEIVNNLVGAYMCEVEQRGRRTVLVLQLDTESEEKQA